MSTNPYQEMRTRQQAEVNAFPMFFAFNKQQFAEGMRKLGLSPSDTRQVCSIFGGGYCRKSDAAKLNEMFTRHRKELEDAIASDKKDFIVATESGILHEMRKKCPEKNFIPAPPEDSTCACNECNFMRLNTLEKLYNTLKYEWPEVTVDEAVAEEAVKPIKKMLEISEKLGL